MAEEQSAGKKICAGKQQSTTVRSEERVFGGVRAFKRNVLRKLKRKEI